MKTTQLYPLFLECSAVDTDTRKIRKNSIFFALKGDNFNGNSYALEALKLGAKYAVVDEKEYGNHPNILLVEDCLIALQQLAHFHRKTLNTPIISLTGSNGKTTTKELINAVLSKKFTTTATIGNLNNHIGVPLTLLSINNLTEIGIVEMGANHLKEIELLCSIAEPNFGYITNFGKAHLEGFGSIEGVVKGKSELYDSLRKNKGIAFINTDDKQQVVQSNGIETISFNGADIIFLEANPFVKVQYKDTVITSQLIGKYNYNNIAVAIAMGTYFNVSTALIKEGIENYVPSNNRSQILAKGSNKIILDAYNANPSSMSAALENFKQLDSNNKIALLGDMFELGSESGLEHQKIAETAMNCGFKEVHLIGKAFSTTSVKNAFIYDSFESFKNSKEKLTFTDATILIKGSRGMALERILDLF